MNTKLKETFDNIHAEEELKDRTREFLAHKTKGYRDGRIFSYGRMAPVFVCFLFLLAGLGSYGIYFTPVSIISIDVNPSVELGINRFDKVVSVEGYNEDGQELAAAFDIRFMEYTDALNQILTNESIANCLAGDEILSIAVVGADDEKSGRMLSDVENCIAGHRNAYCYSARQEDAAVAHAAGLSCGKYRAFLQAQEIDPDITVERIRGMTMREIHDLTGTLPSDHSGRMQEGYDAESRHGGFGNGHGSGHRQRNSGNGH